MNKFLPAFLTMTLIIGFFILAPTFITSRPQEAALSIAEVSIQMEQDTVRTLNVHTTLNINELAWVSSDSTLLTVHQGRLTALKAGLVTVWVFHDETALSDSITIEILEVPLTPQALNDPQPFTIVDPIETDIEIPSEPEPEVPVIEEPEPEVPVVPVHPTDPDDEVVTPPTIYTITITNETGAVITTLEVEEGSFITTSSLELPDTFKGFYLEGETCEDEPFDLQTPITENITLIQASFNDQAPCLQLDYIVLSGRPVAGTTLTVDIFPIGANVTISWYTSVNNRTYREIPGESSSTFTVRPEDSGKFIRVYVVSDSNPPVVRYDTIKLDVFKTVDSEPTCKIILTATDLIAIHQNLAGCYELGANIDLSGYTNLTQSFINGTFTGTLDGSGFSILNLTINLNIDYIGLFQIISGASLTDLTLEIFNIRGRKYVGTLAGSALHSTLSSIQLISNQVSGTRILGGMVGQGVALTMSNSALSNTTISGLSNQLGG